MYEERKEKFTVRDIILQVLIVALFVFLLIWLFPTKGFMNKKVDPLLDTIFNTNVMTMKDAAKDYFTLERLPQKEGEKVKLTLGKMLDLKLLLPFVDKYGESCNLDKSYVEVTKKDSEYEMKVYLKCSKQEDYIIVHMGCYDYCLTTICEKKDEEIKDSNDKPVKPVTPTPDPKPEKKLECKYVLSKGGDYTPWSEWSAWTTEKLVVKPGEELIHEVDDSRVDKVKEDKETIIGYKDITYLDGNKPQYTKYQIVAKKEITTTCKKFGYKETTTVTSEKKYIGETYLGVFASYTTVSSTDTDRYELVNVQQIPCQENCSVATVYTYKWYAKTYEITYKEDVQKGEYGCLEETQTVKPLYGTINLLTGYGTSVRTEPIIKIEQIETLVRYYSERTRKYVNGSSVDKWSKCNDNDLLNNGWKFTGETREA